MRRYRAEYGRPRIGKTVARPREPETPRCLSRREQEEWVCPTCGLRWDIGDERPDCPKKGKGYV